MDYKIPLFNLNFDEEEQRAVLDVLVSRWISTGPKNRELEDTFASMLGIEYGLALTNCTAALHLALKVLGVGEGDEVIVPSLTFVATANAVRYTGAKPVFCDIASYDDLTIDPDAVENSVSDRTKAILVMHYGGFPCDMDRIMEIAGSRGLKVIEDASHAPLSEYKGKKLGTIGHIGCFSFFSNKNISTGEGGMLVTGSEEVYSRAKLLRSHGMTTLSYERSKGHSTSYDVVDLGYNYRMDDMRAAIGIVQLGKLPADLDKRSAIRRCYLEKLSGAAGVIVPFEKHDGFTSNYIFPIVLEDSDVGRREAVREDLHKSGIQTSVHYPAVHRFSIYNDDNVRLEKTEYVADNEVTLPLYSGMDGSDVEFICERVKRILE